MLHTLLISISLLLRLTAQNTDDCSTLGEGGGISGRVLAHQIITDDFTVALYEESTDAIAKQHLYNFVIATNEELLNDNILMAQRDSLRARTDVQQFITNYNQSVLRLTDSVLHLLADGNYAAAYSLNNAISSNNDVVQQTRAYVDLYLSYLQNESLLTDSAYQAQVYYMATLCPLQYGSMVYLAQALYSRAYPDALFQDDDACETIEARRANRKPQTKVFDNIVQAKYDEIANDKLLLVYPNPTSDLVTINLKTATDETINKIEIYNLIGDLVYQKINLTNNSILLDVSKLNSGNYLIKATTIGQHYYLHKLNITK
ncbi:MAG: hypothetical protein RL708_1311 [Bacteroidota bacterium]